MADYFRLELDDYSGPSFVSWNKEYFATMADIRDFIEALSKAKKNQHLIDAFRAYESGQTDATHIVAYQEVRLLAPVRVLHRETVEIENLAWEHTNTWGCGYDMRCDKVCSEHLWIECEGKFYRALKATFTNLCYEGFSRQWIPLGDMLWGYPCVLAGTPGGDLWNRLAEPEKSFKTEDELQQDWQAFKTSATPDYTHFCNDIFGNG